MRVVKAAAVQLSPVLYSREGTVERVVRKIHELGRQEIQFATFPEAVVPYYPYFSFIQSPHQIIAELLSLQIDRTPTENIHEIPEKDERNFK